MSVTSCIKAALDQNTVYWKDHILRRMRQRNISVIDILDVLRDCMVIEEYHDDRPFPSYLIFGYGNKRPVHIVVGINMDVNEIHLITAYIPDTSIWEDDYRRRK